MKMNKFEPLNKYFDKIYVISLKKSGSMLIGVGNQIEVCHR